jgi:excisionase family DNA binding protein
MSVTPGWLAKQAGVSREYIARLCRDGVLRCTKPGGRDWLIDHDSAERWLKGRNAERKADR